MPGVPAFLSGFGLEKNLSLDDFVLVDIQASHHTIVQYSHYEYPLTLTFKGHGDPDKLISDLKSRTRGEKTIMSSYGNPYKCSITNWRYTVNGDSVKVEAYGQSFRI